MNRFTKEPSSLDYFSEYIRNPSLYLRNRLVEQNMGLVRHLAHQYAQKCKEPYEDLEQIGCLGLIRAIERFKPQQRYAFSSFAMPYIRGEILHYFRDKGNSIKIPRRWQELYSKGKKIRRQLTISLAREPREKEIAQVLQISLEQWYECQMAQKSSFLISLDKTLKLENDGEISLYETLLDPRASLRQNLVEERIRLQEALNKLDSKTRRVIRYIFFEQNSRKQAAKRIGISPVTITRQLKKGIESLSLLMN